MAMDGNHYEILTSTLAGERPVDEQAFASVAILTERLQCLKNQSPLFAGVEFSSHVKRLKQRSEPMSVV